MKQNKLLDLAIKVASTIPFENGKQRVAAVALDKRGNILSIKTNNYNKSHPVQKMYAERAGTPLRQYLHAEVACLLTSRGQAHTIAVARVNKQGKALPASPCPVCSLAIQESKVKRIIHT